MPRERRNVLKSSWFLPKLRGCEVIAYQGEKMWLLTNEWEDISEDNDKQPDWQQEWEDFGEVYDDEPNYI
jgi:hypothetical protein